MSELTQVDNPENLDEPRRVELTLSRVDPWGVLKIGFLLAIALGIATVVATIVLWYVLDGMNVFGTLEDFLNELGAASFLELLDYLALPKVVAYSTIFGVANVIIFTAISTLAALLYNLVATLVGGVGVTLMDE